VHNVNALFSDFGFVWLHVRICQDGGVVGFVEFTKLLFALSSLSHPFNRVRSIPEHVFVILSQRKACAERFGEETAETKTKKLPHTQLLTRKLCEPKLLTLQALARLTLTLQTLVKPYRMITFINLWGSPVTFPREHCKSHDNIYIALL